MIEVGGVFHRNNTSPTNTKLLWTCDLCKEHLSVPSNNDKYLQFEDNQICPRCKTRYDVTSIVIFDN